MQTGNTKRFYLTIICILFGYSLFSQIADYQFSTLSRKNGLPTDLVHCGLMDSQGFMWLGTHKGLARWDGADFKLYNSNTADDYYFQNCIFYDLKEDKEGFLWFATIGEGIFRYDPENEHLEHFIPPSNLINPTERSNNVTSLYIDDDGIVWLGTFTCGFFRFDYTTKEFTNIPLKEKLEHTDEGFRLNTVQDIIGDINNPAVLWVAGNDGLYRYHKKTKKLDYFPSTSPGTSTMSCQKLFMEDPNSLWIGTYGAGLIRFDVKKEEWNYNLPQQQAFFNAKYGSANIVLGIESKSSEELWVNTLDLGFGTFNKRTQEFQFLASELGNRGDNYFQEGRNIYVDPIKRVWVFDYESAVGILAPSNKLFDYYPLDLGDCYDGEYKGITNFAFDSCRNQTYITGRGCHAFYIVDEAYNLKSQIKIAGEINPFQLYETVLVDHACQVWVGGLHTSKEQEETPRRPSLYKLNQENQFLEPVSLSSVVEAGIQQRDVRKLYEDSKNRLWLGLNQATLAHLDWEKNKVYTYNFAEFLGNEGFKSIAILDILESGGLLYLATEDAGMLSFDPSTGVFEQLYQVREGEPVMDTRTTGVSAGPNGDIWVSSSVGVYPLFSIKKLDLSQLIETSPVDELQIDDQNNIWVTTQDGLYYFNQDIERFPVRFSSEDGLKDNFFRGLGFKQLSNGTFLIGQQNGFCRFNPESSSDPELSPKLALTSFKVFQEEKQFEKDKPFLEEIELAYDQNFITLGLAILKSDPLDRRWLAYQMEGVDKDWVYPGTFKNSVDYTDLGPGHYTFKFKGGVYDGAWNYAEQELKIVITPPWWKTWWAYVIYVAIGIAILFALRQYDMRRLSAKNEVKRLSELDRLKTNLYTNITHEFRTPLTVIQGMADQLDDKTKAKDLILRNSKNLLRLVTQMLDMAKIESGNMKLQFIRQDIVPFLRYLTESFHSYAETKHIQLSFYSEVKSLEMDYEPDKLQHIVSNLLSNAIKFTPEHGQVILHVKGLNGNQDVQVKVQDSGIGIPQSFRSKIFDRFFQVEDSQTNHTTGTGIGLSLTKELVELMNGTIAVESEENVGTEFFVTLPVKQAGEVKDMRHEATPAIEASLPQAGVGAREVYSDLDEPANGTADRPLLLIIEDSPDVAFYIKTCLQEEYEIRIAENGQLGIDKALEIIPDIIISDVMMPKKNGYQVTQELKNDKRTSHIPIILLTAKADMSSRLEGLERGADAYLSKPFHKKELLIRLRSLIKLRQKMQARYNNVEVEIPPATEDVGLQIEDAFLKEVREVVEANLNDTEFNVSLLCREIGVSQSQLYRKVKALTNQSIASHIRTIRLQHGKRLLETTDYTVSEVAYEVGFKDPFYFSKTFSQAYGYPPSETRSVNGTS